jgi:hypothetical protein
MFTVKTFQTLYNVVRFINNVALITGSTCLESSSVARQFYMTRRTVINITQVASRGLITTWRVVTDRLICSAERSVILQFDLQ